MKLTDKTLIGKEIFEAYLNRNGEQSIYAEIANKYSISISTARKYLSLYRKRVVSPKPNEDDLIKYETILKKIQKNQSLNDYDTNLIDELLKLKKVKDLINYATITSYSATELLNQIKKSTSSEKLTSNNILKLKKISSVLETKREDITKNRRDLANKLRKQNLIKKHLKTIKEIIEICLIEGNHNLKKLLDEKEIKKETFFKYFPYLNKGNEEEINLYQKYSEVLKLDEKEHEDVYLNVLYYIKNGIEKNGVITAFNLLDYYRITKINLEELQKRAHKLINDKIQRYDYDMVGRFIKTYRNSNLILSKEEALDYYYSINGREITTEEKEFLINYLENNLKIDLNVAVFQCGCEEIIKNQFVAKTLSFE